MNDDLIDQAEALCEPCTNDDQLGDFYAEAMKIVPQLVGRIKDYDKILRARAGPPKQLPAIGTGAHLLEQQDCYDMGYRDGVAALRSAQKKKLEEMQP